MRRARTPLILTAAALTLMGASLVNRAAPVLIWNATASVPVGLYLIAPHRQPKVGDLVALRPPPALEVWLVESGYLGSGMPLLKPIAALPGAHICRHGRTIIIDGVVMAQARERDRAGRALPIWQGCHRLREGEVFVLNRDAPGSLDGRYFGPLPADTIIGRAIPIWTQVH